MSLLRLLPGPGGGAGALVERNVVGLRRFWIVVLGGFFEPVFYLFSVGIGVGALVGTVELDGRTVAYAAFVAPALMAASAMNGAVYDASMNVFYKLKYAKLYDSMLATPMRVNDVAVGEIGWALLRGLIYSGGFYTVLLAVGLAGSPWSLLAIPACTLIGFAFAACAMAIATYARSFAQLSGVEIVVMLLFVLSATFFPLSTYPTGIQWLVQATPLYHGVALVRALMFGALEPGLLWHVAYLVGLGLIGTVIVSRRLRRLLLS